MIMLCSTDRTKTVSRGSPQPTGRIMLDRTGGGALAVPRALPLSIGSISLSSCQLFLCARQIVADGGDENRG